MKILFLVPLLTSLLALAPLRSPAEGDKYSVDAVHSQVVFKIRHMGVSNNYGRFNKISGEFTYDEKDPTKSSVEITVDATSVDTANQGRDDHLRGQDFLSAKEFPSITFKSTAVKAGAGKGVLDVTGDFMLHGVKKSITVRAEHIGSGKGMKPGETRCGFEIDFVIKRSDYGINLKKFADALGDEITLHVNIEGARG